MRTLKKVLALSLVFAMAFTMMAGAAFKDQDKIDTALTNDIQLLTALGVFQGDENGNFNPTDNVRRSEAAKMIYVLKNNGVDDGAVAFQGVSKYSDVPVGHWAEGYINYCTNLGYMGGWKENGVQKFDPNGNVTGVELMKMLLCMVGYKADIQGYTGNGWQTNVLVDAATSGLSTNFIPSVYGATPRQWTARLMTNALDAKYVTYSKGELTYGETTYAEQFLGLRTQEGILTETNHNKLEKTTPNSVQAILNSSDEVKVEYTTSEGNKSITAVGDADDSLLGQPVKMYYKKAGTTAEAKLYAVLPYSKDQKVVETTVDSVKVSNKSGEDTVTVEGLGTQKYGSSDTFDVYANNVLVAKGVAGDKIHLYLGNNVNDQVTLITKKDSDKIGTIKLHTLVAFAEVKKIDAEKGVFTLEQVSSWLDGLGGELMDENNQSITFDNAHKDNFSKYLNVTSDVKDGSIVKIVADFSSGKPVYNVSLADKVEGTVSSYNLSKDGTTYDTLTVNGTSLQRAEGTNEMKDYDWKVAKNIHKHDTFYTDGKYVVYSTASEEVASVSNLAYIIDTDYTTAWGKDNYKVKALLADGTQGEYEVAAAYDELGVKVEKADSVKVKGSPATSVNGSDLNSAERYNSESNVRNAMSGIKNDVLSYSITDGKITLKAIETEASLNQDGKLTYMSTGSGNAVFVNTKNNIATVGTDKDTGTQYKVNDSTIFFVKSGDKYSVVKASELQNDVKTNNAKNAIFAAQKVNGFDTLLAGVLDGSLPVAVEDYYFVTGTPNYIGKVDGKYTIEMPVNAAGTESKLTFKYDDDNSINADLATLNGYVGKLVKVDQKGDTLLVNEVSKITISGNWKKGSLTAWDGKSAVVDNAFVSIADGAKIFNVDVTGDPANAAKQVEGDSVTFSEGGKSNAVYLTNDDGKIVAIFTEVDGADISFIAQ